MIGCFQTFHHPFFLFFLFFHHLRSSSPITYYHPPITITHHHPPTPGRYVDKVKIKNPIGLLYSPALGLIFVGSKKSSKSTGAVFAINVTSRAIAKTYTLLGGSTMDHPTGLAIHEDTLFVAEQSMNVVLSFNVTSGRYITQVVGTLNADGVEHIMLSDC